MIVSFINKERINSITLPEKVRGQYWIDYSNGSSSNTLMGIEGVNGEWILKSNQNVQIIDNTVGPIRNTVLNPLSIYNWNY